MRPGRDRATLRPAPTQSSAREPPLEGTVTPALFPRPLQLGPGAVPGWSTSPSPSQRAPRGTRDAAVLIEDEALSQATDMSAGPVQRERPLSSVAARVGAHLWRCGEPSGAAPKRGGRARFDRVLVGERLGLRPPQSRGSGRGLGCWPVDCLARKPGPGEQASCVVWRSSERESDGLTLLPLPRAGEGAGTGVPKAALSGVRRGPGAGAAGARRALAVLKSPPPPRTATLQGWHKAPAALCSVGSSP